MNLVAGMVRRKKVSEALDLLKFLPKKAAKQLYKILHSAVSNAENNFKQSKDDLIIKEILVSPGATLKRHVPVSRGRSHPILKRTTHVKLTVGMEEGAETKPEKEETKKEVGKKEAKAPKQETAEKKDEKEPEVKVKTPESKSDKS
jgi:large subunit ribosomal protein L22